MIAAAEAMSLGFSTVAGHQTLGERLSRSAMRVAYIGRESLRRKRAGAYLRDHGQFITGQASEELIRSDERREPMADCPQ